VRWQLIATWATLWLAAVGCSGVSTPRCPSVPHANTNGDSPVCHEANPADGQARLEVKGGVITVDFDPAEFDVPRDVIWKWIDDAARAVVAYYGHFPVAQCNLRITSTFGRGVGFGQAWGYSKIPTISVDLGRGTRAEDLADDWTLTHEMVHLAFPSLARTHHWLEEGLATYIEPIARFKAGLRSEESVWHEWLQSMSQGQPEEGDRGLDYTHTWGRVYWGGALFALVSDVEIRRASSNRQGLRHALQGILNSGGTMAVTWTITDTLAMGDRATQTQILSVEYQKRRAAPAPVDLDQLWANLGVRLVNGRVVLDDRAPWADIRQRILRD
jgi:hypothetical protein